MIYLHCLFAAFVFWLALRALFFSGPRNPIFEFTKMNAYAGLGLYTGLEVLPWRIRFVFRFYLLNRCFVVVPWGKMLRYEVENPSIQNS